MQAVKLHWVILGWVVLTGCLAAQPIHTVQSVDLDRFMGNWHVIASIPTFIEKEAFNAAESYHLNADGTVATTFRFNRGDFDGPAKTYTPRGFIRDQSSNAVWGMKFVWPFKADTRPARNGSCR